MDSRRKGKKCKQTGHPQGAKLKVWGGAVSMAVHAEVGWGQGRHSLPTRPLNLGSKVWTEASHCSFGTGR